MDPRWRTRLADATAAVLLSIAVTHAAKMLIGRPRPKFNDPDYFCGPFGAYPVKHGLVASGWEVWRGISSDLASMPSSHTSAAMTLAVVLAWFYPRLRWLLVFLVITVGVARVILQAHYPADVAAGATLGYLAAIFALSGRWGSRVARIA
jgi:membrane-associated phospholipid phosphatase